MNMLYGSSKILHGPSAREEPRAECLWLPNIINYLCAFTSSCCVWPAMSLSGRAGVGVACLLMNTNYTSVSLSLNVSLLFPASPRLLVNSGAPRSDFMQWISTGSWSTQAYWLKACMSSSVTVVNAIQADEINRDSVRLSLLQRKCKKYTAAHYKTSEDSLYSYVLQGEDYQ